MNEDKNHLRLKPFLEVLILQNYLEFIKIGKEELLRINDPKIKELTLTDLEGLLKRTHYKYFLDNHSYDLNEIRFLLQNLKNNDDPSCNFLRDWLDSIDRKIFWSLFPVEAEALKKIEGLIQIELGEEIVFQLTLQNTNIEFRKKMYFILSNNRIICIAFLNLPFLKRRIWDVIFQFTSALPHLQRMGITNYPHATLPPSITSLTYLDNIFIFQSHINRVPDPLKEIIVT